MKEIDLYDILGQELMDKLDMSWYLQTHGDYYIIVDESKNRIEADIALGKEKNILTDVVHVKTFENFQRISQKWDLIGKSILSLQGIPNVWVVIENRVLDSTLQETLSNSIGIVTYSSKKELGIKDIDVYQRPSRKDLPRFFKNTQKIFQEKYGESVTKFRNIFVCNIEKEYEFNWEICKKYGLWGTPSKGWAPTLEIKRVKPGDILIFRISKKGFVGVWVATSFYFEDKKGGPWKLENKKETRDFNHQVKMVPLSVPEFENPIDLKWKMGYYNEDTGLSIHKFKAGMGRITERQFGFIFNELIKKNLDQLVKNYKYI